MAFELLTPHRQLGMLTKDTLATFGVNMNKDGAALVINLHADLVAKASIKVGDRVQILYDIGTHQVMLRPGISASYKVQASVHTDNVHVRRNIVHGAHQEPLPPKRLTATPATSVEVTERGEIILGVPVPADA